MRKLSREEIATHSVLYGLSFRTLAKALQGYRHRPNAAIRAARIVLHCAYELEADIATPGPTSPGETESLQ